MDFKISYQDHTEIHETMQTVKYSLKQTIAYWNNFFPEEELVIKLSKVPSKTDTIGINVKEDINTDDQVS